MNLMMMTLLDYLNNPDISSVDFVIAQYIIHHADEFNNITITQMADLLGVSISQISRFVHHIGLSSFQECKDVIQCHGKPSRHSFIQKNNDYHHVYLKYVQEEIEFFFNHFDVSTLSGLINDFKTYQKIGLFGMFNSGNAAKELQYNLALNGLLCVSMNEFNHQVKYIQEATHQTLIIIYSLSGEYVLDNVYSRYYHMLPVLKKSEAKIYVLTNNRDVQSLSYIDQVIYVPILHRLYQYTFQCLNDLILMEYQKSLFPK